MLLPLGAGSSLPCLLNDSCVSSRFGLPLAACEALARGVIDGLRGRPGARHLSGMSGRSNGRRRNRYLPSRSAGSRALASRARASDASNRCCRQRIACEPLPALGVIRQHSHIAFMRTQPTRELPPRRIRGLRTRVRVAVLRHLLRSGQSPAAGASFWAA